MSRVHNFNPGPAALPLEVLEQARDEMLDYRGSGMSIMEHSHRGAEYEAVHNEARALVKELLALTAEYEVLFLQGGASLQFAMVPMNFLPPGRSADYLVTDIWSEKALSEAQIVGKARAAANSKADGVFTRVPSAAETVFDQDAAYVHITTNNTLFGTQWHRLPDTERVPLIGDLSSDFMWAPAPIGRFAMVYAGAQKNLGPSGVTLVIGKKDFLDGARKDIPAILRYATHVKADSLYNTPPTFGVYMVRNVLAWTKAQGGLPAMEARNRKKAALIYDCLDASADFYRAPVEKASRSFMNIVFRTPSDKLDAAFVSEAEDAGLVGLKGHRSTGGIRASLYNAVPVAAVEALARFMREFAERHA